MPPVRVYCDNACIDDDVTGAWIAGLEHSVSYIADREGEWYFEATVYDSEDENTSAKTQTITVTEPECEHDYQTIDQTSLTEYENTNDSQHRIIYHHASVCSKCEDVKSTWISEDFEPHVFNAEGKCVCGAIAETDPDCVHEWNSTVSETKVEQTNRNDRMEKHMVTTVYADVCGKCGSQDSHEKVEYVSHVFDKNGYCECGYVEVTDDCDHATTGVPEGDPVYESIDKSVHSVTTYERHKCECGQVNELRETTVQAPHTFVDGFCVCGLADPGPACPHSTTDVAWDTNYSITYKSVSDTEHSMTGYMYEYCTECFEHICDSYAMTKNYEHTLDAAGDCTDCDYRAGCKHAETTKQYVDTSYTSIDETYHKATDIYSLVCANPDCGKVVVALDSSLNMTIEEEHQFDGNACTLCDYVKADVLTVTVVAGQSTANTDDTISAKATIAGGSGNYSISWTVTLDGITIDQTDMSMANSYSYVADKAGSYVFTAIVQDSAGNTQTASSGAIVVKVAHNWKTVTSTEIINQSVKIHDIVTTTYEECTICGEKTEPVVTTQSVEHVIIRTSYESAHPHQKFNVCRDCSAHPPVEGAYQTANGTVQSKEKCCICHGHVWQIDEPEEVNGEWREYCMNCGRYRTVDAPVVEDTEPEEHVHAFSNGVCVECGIAEVITPPYELTDPDVCDHLWTSPYTLNGISYKQCVICETEKLADGFVLPEERLEIFTEHATSNGTELNDLYFNDIFGSSNKSMFNHVSSAIMDQYIEDGMLATAPEELYKMLTDVLGYVGEAITEDTFEEKTISELELLIKSMLARQTESSSEVISEAKDAYSVVDTSTSVLAEFVNWGKVYSSVGRTQDEILALHQIGKFSQNTVTAMGIVIDSIDILSCSVSDLTLLATLVANYDQSISMLDAMIEQCGEDSQIGVACRNVKADVEDQFKATVDECKKAGSAMAGVFVKAGTKIGISSLSTIEGWMLQYNVPIMSNRQITGTITKTSTFLNPLKNVANVTGGILLGGDIGALITYNTGRFLNAKDQIMLLTTIDAQVKSSMITAYNNESEALLPLTQLWLVTQQTGLDATKEYFSSYADSWYNQFANSGTVETAKQCLVNVQADESEMKAIANTVGITLDKMSTVYTKPQLSFAGDRMIIQSSIATFLYSEPNANIDSRIGIIPKETQMFLLGGGIIEKDGKKWYKVSYEGVECYIEATNADLN